MAFVFRSQLHSYIKSSTPGPSHYQPQPIFKLQRPASVPFNQLSPRNIWESNNLPGPGAYETPVDVSYERLFVEEYGKIILSNRKSQSFNFKSGIQRFKNNDNKLPGPGHYDTTQIYAKKQFNRQQREQSAKSGSNSLQKYLLMTHNKIFEKQQGKLDIILDEQSQSSKKNKVQNSNQQKKAVPFNSSAQRAVKVRPQTSVGPGSYNICAQQKISDNHRLKPSYSLAKFKKIDVTENQEKHELNSQNRISFGKEQKKAERTKKHVKMARKKDEFFGSTVGRFYSILSAACGPGPGAYEVNASNDKQNKKTKSKLAFGRFSSPQKAYFKPLVSPFIVDVAVQNRVLKPVDKKNWNFGSRQPRFKEKPQQAGQLMEYQRLKICVGGNYNKLGSQNKQNMKLKLKINKHSAVISGQKQKIADQRPLCYAASANTISHKIGRKYQAYAPFSTQVTRFAEVEEAINIIDHLLSQNKQNIWIQHRGKKKLEPKGLMDSVNPRLDHKPHESNLSPCSYDPHKPMRKEFNKLFL